MFGLSLSSSWGNGHATTYRALLKALAARGHDILFLEREQPWYTQARDLVDPAFCRLAFYECLDQLRGWRAEVGAADLVVIGSYVPEGIALASLVRPWARMLAFYDIDTPVTLRLLEAGDAAYISAALIPAYDLYLSFTGGPVLRMLERDYGARAARALFCAADPDLYWPGERAQPPRWDLGYLGTYSGDRQPALERLLLEPARRAPARRFVVAGSQYPADMDWPANVERIEHLPPAEHLAFYTSLAWTLNVTRADMIAAGHSPSVRLFEAAACATPVISDIWPGLDQLLRPGSEIVLAETSADVLAALDLSTAERRAIGHAACRRIGASHSSDRRARELEGYVAELVYAGR